MKLLDREGNTVVHTAARYGLCDTLTYFVEKGYAAVVTLRNRKGETPIVLAKRNKHLDCIFVLEGSLEDSQKL
jgi:ankyrin repeat protein